MAPRLTAQLTIGARCGGQACRTSTPQAGFRWLARLAGCSCASASVHRVADGSWPRPATGGTRHWAAPLPPSRHIPHPLTTPARCAHRFALPPFDIQVILGGASGPWAPSGSGIRRDAAPQTDAESHSAPLPQSRSAGVPPRAAASSHDPVTPRAPLGPLCTQAARRQMGLGGPGQGAALPSMPCTPRTGHLPGPEPLPWPALASCSGHTRTACRDQNEGPQQPPLPPLCTYIQSLVCSMSF